MSNWIDFSGDAPRQFGDAYLGSKPASRKPTRLRTQLRITCVLLLSTFAAPAMQARRTGQVRLLQTSGRTNSANRIAVPIAPAPRTARQRKPLAGRDAGAGASGGALSGVKDIDLLRSARDRGRPARRDRTGREGRVGRGLGEAAVLGIGLPRRERSQPGDAAVG